MFELDKRFDDKAVYWQEKIKLIAYVYNVPAEYVQNEINALCNTQIKENRMWDHIVSRILNVRGKGR